MSSFIETEEQQALRKAVAAMAANYGEKYYPEKEYGGGGAGMYELSLVMEEMSAAGCALLLMVVAPAINGTIISKFGTDEQKKR